MEMRGELDSAMDHIVVRHETADESHHNDRRLCGIHRQRIHTRRERTRQPILPHNNESRANKNDRSD